VRNFSAALLFSIAIPFFLKAAQAENVGGNQFLGAMRTLEAVQDATAAGDPTAADLQSKLMVQVSEDLKNLKQANLEDSKSLKAIAVYLLSGGSPDIVERHLLKAKINPEFKNLIDGALAYARGDKYNALKFLNDIAPASLPPSLGGRVALVKAILKSAEDIKSSLGMLNLARGLMPGTLVEEAALRRCINFSGKMSDIAEFERCASLYIRHFPKSIYWQEFEDSFISGLIDVDYLNAGGSSSNLYSVLNDLSPLNQRKILLSTSNSALNHGRFLLARTCAARALEMSRAGSADMERSNLYLGTAMIAMEDFDDGKSKLEAINKSVLKGSDQAFLEKALDLVAQIAKKPDVTPEQAIEKLAPEERDGKQSVEYTSLLSRAQSALADLDPVKVN
jgi:chemotaxis protein MotC